MRSSKQKNGNTWSGMLQSSEFHVFLFSIFFAVLCIFAVFPSQAGLAVMFDMNTFFAFFLVWGAVIALLAGIARSLRPDTDKNAKTKAGGETDV